MSYKISYDEYRNVDAVSRSTLLDIKRSVKYYNFMKNNELKETPALKFGKAFHSFILEPEYFESEYFVMDQKIDKRTKEGKAKFDEILLKAGNREILDLELYESLLGMKNALDQNTVIKENNLIDPVDTEQSFFWDISIGDDVVKCKARTDKILKTQNSKFVLELKTTCNIDNFQHEIFSRSYHLQAAFYIDAVESVTKEECRKFLIIAIEKDPPYLNKVYFINSDSKVIEAGRIEYMDLLSKYLKHKKNGFIEEDVAIEVEVPKYLQLGD